MKKAPTNTKAQFNPRESLLEAMIMGSSGAIEHQEAQGQREFVGSETLPTDLGGKWGGDPKSILEAAGVKFLGPAEGDELFQYVELPAGWKKQATDHSMHSDLLDEKGRKRAGIFYKAAFYDRSADLLLYCRYSVRFDYDRADKEKLAVANVKDGDKVIFSTEPVKINSVQKSYEFSDKANEVALAWLKAHYPDHANPGAYWD
jgi:hypothetical protein